MLVRGAAYLAGVEEDRRKGSASAPPGSHASSPAQPTKAFASGGRKAGVHADKPECALSRPAGPLGHPKARHHHSAQQRAHAQPRGVRARAARAAARRPRAPRVLHLPGKVRRSLGVLWACVTCPPADTSGGAQHSSGRNHACLLSFLFSHPGAQPAQERHHAHGPPVVSAPFPPLPPAASLSFRLASTTEPRRRKARRLQRLAPHSPVCLETAAQRCARTPSWAAGTARRCTGCATTPAAAGTPPQPGPPTPWTRPPAHCRRSPSRCCRRRPTGTPRRRPAARRAARAPPRPRAGGSRAGARLPPPRRRRRRQRRRWRRQRRQRCRRRHRRRGLRLQERRSTARCGLGGRPRLPLSPSCCSAEKRNDLSRPKGRRRLRTW